jgi:hypothetical protein
VGHKRLSTTEIYVTLALGLAKVAYDLHGFAPVSAWVEERLYLRGCAYNLQIFPPFSLLVSMVTNSVLANNPF